MLRAVTAGALSIAIAGGARSSVMRWAFLLFEGSSVAVAGNGSGMWRMPARLEGEERLERRAHHARRVDFEFSL